MMILLIHQSAQNLYQSTRSGSGTRGHCSATAEKDLSRQHLRIAMDVLLSGSGEIGLLLTRRRRCDTEQ
jgi:hypothetical protein